MNRFRIAILTLFLAVYGALLSCSNNTDTALPCPPTIDTIKTILTQKYNGKNYFLVKRIAGWHDKTIIIQLFDEKPKLDECNQDLINPIFEDSIDQDTPLVKLSVNLDKKDFNFTYASTETQQQAITLEFID